MCGIAGIFNTRSKSEIDSNLLERMRDALVHRGPDGAGSFVDPGVGLGHRRLSIIDVSAGQQPLFNEDHSVVVVYNGEIYNFNDLAKKLEAKGHVFRTRCDTEVIVHAWEEWGERCVDRFRGMFAFALWDKNQETLFLARDRIGIKPLHYAFLPNGEFIFASEIKSLLLHPEVSRTLDPCAIEDYLAYGYIPDPKSIFSQISKLPPGYSLVVKRGVGAIKPQQYWDLSFDGGSSLSEGAVAEELVAQLKEAVDIRLVSEVPLGAFLSGGVDSSAVVSMMASLTDDPVKTCSISFGDKKFNEAPYAEQVAKRYGTDHFESNVESQDFDLLDTLSGIYDEPYADSSALPTYRLCELARSRVTVALSGDGGDENFGGYEWYPFHLRKDRIRRSIPSALRSSIFAPLGKLYPKLDWAPRVFRAKTTFETLAMSASESLARSLMTTTEDVRRKLYSSQFKRELQGYSAAEVFREHAKKAPTDDPLSFAQYLDFKIYLPADILTKVDRASMANSLEVRVPILDHKFVEWAAGIPSNLKLRNGKGKYIFKKAMEPYLSSDILYRKKMGFSIPLADWLRGPLRKQAEVALLGSDLAATEYFNRGYLEQILREHQSKVRDHGYLIWSLLLLESFQRKVL